MNRREFLWGAGSMSLLAGCRSYGLFGAPELRFGVVSDIHVTTPESTRMFERALRYFRSRGADAVMVSGDLTDWGLRPSLGYVKATWDRVFAGTDVVPLFCTGNHDYDGWAYSDMAVEMHANGYSEKDRLRKSCCQDLGIAWSEVFGEPFAPFRVRTVKGYDFVSVEWEAVVKDATEQFPAWMARHGARFRGKKPFFCFQHAPIKGTTPDGDGWADNGTGFEALKNFPNAIAFTGHSHETFNDERTIWQGAFTVIDVPSLSYTGAPAGIDAENGGGARNGSCKKAMPRNSERLDLRGGQGYFVSVYADRMVVERIDVEEDCAEGADAWIVPLDGTRPFDPVRRTAASLAPVFPAGAAFRSETRNTENRTGAWTIVMDCRFPRAEIADGTRILYYEIKAVPKDGSAPMVKRFLSPAFARMPEYEPETMHFWFDVAELPQDRDYVLEARAFNGFGKASPPLISRVWHGSPAPSKTDKAL